MLQDTLFKHLKINITFSISSFQRSRKWETMKFATLNLKGSYYKL